MACCFRFLEEPLGQVLEWIFGHFWKLRFSFSHRGNFQFLRSNHGIPPLVQDVQQIRHECFFADHLITATSNVKFTGDVD
jgi:hypothetical protein